MVEFSCMASQSSISIPPRLDGSGSFFVLAGFLLGSQFVSAAHAPKWPQLISRIAWRILPLYYINLIIVSIGNWFLINRYVDIMSFGMHIFLLQGFSPAVSGSINGVTWTLGTEFACYFLLPWLAPLLMRRTLMGASKNSSF